MRLTPLDTGILRLLQEDARRSFRQIADALGTTTPTVSTRVKALEELGIIQGYRAVVDEGALGGSLHLARIRAPPAALAHVRGALMDVRGVEEVLTLAGGVLLARLRVRPPDVTLAGFHDALAHLGEVTAYDVAEVVESGGDAFAPEIPEDVQVPCHQCHGPIHGEPVKARVGDRAHVFCCRHCLATFRGRHGKLASG